MSNRDRITDLLVVTGLIIYYIVAITFLYKLPFVLLMFVSPIPFVLAKRYKNRKYAAVMAICGMLFGAASETACVYYGLWFYPYTGEIPYIPLWIFVGWSCLPLSFPLILRAIFAKDFRTEYETKSLFYLFAGLFALVLLFILLGQSPWITIVFSMTFATVILLIVKTVEAVVLFVLGFSVGPLVESIPISAGAWSYLYDQMFGMPYWMPIAYGAFALLLVLFSETLASIVTTRHRRKTGVE